MFRVGPKIRVGREIGNTSVFSFGLNSVSSQCTHGKSSIAQKPEVHPKICER